MGKISDLKIHTIKVSDIKTYRQECYVESQSLLEQQRELAAFIKTLCLKDAFSFGGMASYLKHALDSPLSVKTNNFIKKSSWWSLRNLVKNIIVEDFGGAYSSFKMHPHWDREIKFEFFFPFKFYFYKEKGYVNVFLIEEKDLPLYVNHSWNSDWEYSIFLKRFRK